MPSRATHHTTHTTHHTPHSVAILAQVGTVCRGSGLGPLSLSAVFKAGISSKSSRQVAVVSLSCA